MATQEVLGALKPATDADPVARLSRPSASSSGDQGAILGGDRVNAMESRWYPAGVRVAGRGLGAEGLMYGLLRDLLGP
jgi:hypothetical protein